MRTIMAPSELQIPQRPRLPDSVSAALRRLNPEAGAAIEQFNAEDEKWRSDFQGQLSRRLGTIERRIQELEET